MMKPRTRELTMTWGKRVLLAVLVMGAIFYGILSLAERSKDSIRKGLEDYLFQATGHPAEITDMPTVKLTPDLVFRMNGVFIRDRDDKSKLLAHADKAYISMPLWKMFLGVQDLIGFEIQNLELGTGFFLPKKVTADFVGISDPSPDKNPPVFMVDGTYDAQPLLITAEMMRKSKDKHYQYRFSAPFPITFKLGGLEGGGVFDRGLNSVTLKQIQIVHGGNRAEFVLRDIHKDFDGATAEGTINDVPFRGIVRKQGEKTVFNITPDENTPANVEKIAAFLTVVKHDLRLNGNTDKLGFEISGNETQEQKTEETDK